VLLDETTVVEEPADVLVGAPRGALGEPAEHEQALITGPRRTAGAAGALAMERRRRRAVGNRCTMLDALDDYGSERRRARRATIYDA
jgi:hypothetical protein